MNPKHLHEEMESKGLGYPRVTEQAVEASIDKCVFYVFPGTSVTVCCLTLRNGFHVVGSSSCVHPDNFDREIGERLARANAVHRVWELLGFKLRETLNHIGEVTIIPMKESQ